MSSDAAQLCHLPHPFFLVFFFFFFSFYSHTCGICSFPGQGSNWSCSCQPMPQPQQHQIWASSVTYTTACGNTRSLTHRERPGLEPASSQRYVESLTHWATMGTPIPASKLLFSRYPFWLPPALGGPRCRGLLSQELPMKVSKKQCRPSKI